MSQGGAMGSAWSPDGNTVYYLREESVNVYTVMAAHIQRDPVPVVLSTDSLFTKRRASSGGVASDLHPDGDRFIWVRNVGSADPDEGGSEPERFILVNNWFEELRQRMGD